MVEKGVFSNGVPYVRFGKGEKILLVFSDGPGNNLPSGFMIRMLAEMAHDSKNRLAEIKAPTLVIGGDKDDYCPVELLRETAAGILNAKLVLYEGKGHMIMGKKFDEDVLAFLNEQ